MYQIGLSTCGKNINDDLFRNFRDAGLSAMEISTAPENHLKLDWNSISEMSKRYNIKLWSYHLPFQPFENLDVSVKGLAKNTVAYFSELIGRACDVGINKVIIHPSGEPIAEDERCERVECAKESLFSIAETAKSYGAELVVENLPRTCLGRDSKEIQELIGAHKNLRVCFDTNHLLTEDLCSFIHRFKDKIVTVHISDYDFIDEKHWLPGEGKINWKEILKAFSDIEYQGVWMYELYFTNPKVIVRKRDLNCMDISENAKKMFSGKI